jgi:dTDP-4-dehydrorhamnose reductase
MTQVMVLGGTGMLGSRLVEVLSRDPTLAVTATSRGELPAFARSLAGVRWLHFDADDAASLRSLDCHSWVINAIGITKPLIHDDDAAQVERAIRVNSLFPQRLAARCRECGGQLLQIATDCVYSGARGGYIEQDPHDALDVYGKTKSLGESVEPWVHNLRCSIIGREPANPKFLVEWLLRQPAGAEVTGFTNHRWNGVTTYHFARVVQGIIQAQPALPNLQHLVPADELTKAEMLVEIAAVHGRSDIRIRQAAAERVTDRTLHTSAPEINRELWRSAGYGAPPTVREMIREMAPQPRTVAASTRSGG